MKHCVIGLLLSLVTHATASPELFASSPLNNIANVSYAGVNANGDVSIFSPRMDFEQWKPLTGRGDPLRNDPTYDYEPPVLERVHYWADDARPEREHRPERKSEVLMLGVSSKKPSVIPRQPPRRQYRPKPIRYEDFTYKLSEHYPMTILVPPPPPVPGQKLPLFILHEDEKTTTDYSIHPETSSFSYSELASTSDFDLKEANLIFQSSSTSQSWTFPENSTKTLSTSAVSSDYAGWGPTTPIYNDDTFTNITHNTIFNNHPYTFYRPMFSDAPPPQDNKPLLSTIPAFLPTPLPPLPTHPIDTVSSLETTTNYVTSPSTYTDEKLTKAPTTRTQDITQSTKRPTDLFSMLGSMLSMPIPNGPDRPEDNLYAHASDIRQVFKEHIDSKNTLETMQTMQPPPQTKPTESTTMISKRPYHINPYKQNFLNKKNHNKILDPYLNMKVTTMKTTTIAKDSNANTETATIPTYLIIQGHSKVKTYSSKKELSEKKKDNPRPNETNEVKHLHPIKEKLVKNVGKSESSSRRSGRARNLQALVNEGLGSIEIQEANIGIKYDVSDGSEVPMEIYKKGIVENDENDYAKKNTKSSRAKRQISLDDLIPFDEDQLEEFVFKFIEGKKNASGITGFLASIMTSKATDLLEDDDDDEDR